MLSQLLTPNEIKLNIAQMIKSYRIARELTQKELAKKSGINYNTYVRFEQSGDIQIKNLIKIMIVLEITDKLIPLMEKYFNPFEKRVKKRVK
jgi:transcriptional regulator with XRE-family HTH domain